MGRHTFPFTAAALAAFTFSSSTSVDAATLDGTKFWVGAEAGLEIDWYDGTTDHALYWGFRWNGQSTGEDMLRAVVAADRRLSLTTTTYPGYGSAVTSIGFDHNDNGVLSLADGDYVLGGFDNGYWAYSSSTDARLATDVADWSYSDVGITGDVLADQDWRGFRYVPNYPTDTTVPSDPTPASPVPEPTALAAVGLAGLGLSRRRRRVANAAGVLTAVAVSASAMAADSVTVVGGSYTQGTVKSSLTGYSNTATNLHDFATTTGPTNAVTLGNGNYSAATLLAFGNGGGVTLKFDAPVLPLATQKEIGVFTAQFLASNGALFNGNMEASVLVSADGTNWRTLAGVAVADATTYIGDSRRLNAPSEGFVYASGSQSWAYNGTTSATVLATLTPADYLTPMPDDTIFNDPVNGTNAARAALIDDTLGALYASVYGTSGGGNWFDISSSGLASVQYLRLNGVNTDTTGGIRLDSVFANAAAVPEPAAMTLVGVMALVVRRRR